MEYKVKEVADIAGVSVRTLHHYDEIDLLKPAYVGEAGYRYYTDKELERLQQILFFKELDFSLQEIKKILDNPDFNRQKALKMQRELLLKKKNRLENIIESIEKTILSMEGEIEMERSEMFKAFDMSEIEKFKEKYREEVRQKYGNTETYKECEGKTSKYSNDDWAKIQSKGKEIYTKLASLMNTSANNQQVQNLIKEYHNFINENFYTCSKENFRGLGELYISDERFTRNIDKYSKGLSKFLYEAINIYCEKLKE